MAVIYRDTSDFKDRPLSSSWEFPGRSAQMQRSEQSRALPFGTCLPNQQENTSWKAAEKNVFKVTLKTCSRRNFKGWDNFLIVHFGQKLILVCHFLLWRFYSEVKNEPRSWGLAGTFPEEVGTEEMGKNGNTIHIPLTIPWCTKPLNFNSLVQQKR